MSRVRYDLSRVPRELLEKYVDFWLCVTRNNDAGSKIDATSPIGKEIAKIAEVPLRTRAEVDADIGKVVRQYAEEWTNPPQSCNLENLSFSGTFNGCDTLSMHFKELLSEETSD